MTPDLTPERVELFVRHQLPQRPLTVQISPALERRLVAFGEAFNAAVPDDPMNLSHDADLGVLLLACAERGLRDDEDQRGKFASHLEGFLYDLPRPVRAPLFLRARLALEAALTKWRAS
jgi:hypothetical protein